MRARYLEKIENGLLFEDEYNRVVFYDRQHRWRERGDIQAFFTDQVEPSDLVGPLELLSPVSYKRADPLDNWHSIYNVFLVDSGTVQTGRSQTLYDLPDADRGLVLQPNISVRLRCAINQNIPTTGTESVTQVLNWNRPIFTVSADAKGDDVQAVLSSGVLASLVAQDASSCEVVIVNYNRVPVYLQSFSVTGVPVNYRNSFRYYDIVDESIAQYGRREWKFPVEFNPKLWRELGQRDRAGKKPPWLFSNDIQQASVECRYGSQWE